MAIDGKPSGRLTCCNMPEPGNPRSLAKDQHMREAEARVPTFANHCIAVTSEAMRLDPAIEPVGFRKFSMNGYPVGEIWGTSAFVLLNNSIINMPNPIQPFVNSVVMMDLGTTRAAFRISSDIWRRVSASYI